MLDIYTGGLLTVIDDALQPPAHLTPPQLSEWHAHTLRGRLPLIREALRIAREENDAELATQLVDQAITEHPNQPRAVRAVGGDGARMPTPSQMNTPPTRAGCPSPSTSCARSSTGTGT